MASLGASYGSMRVGDKVMAKIYDTAAGLVPGDMGVVECVAPPSPDGLHFVRFVSLMPTRNLLALHSWQLEDETTYLSRQGVSKGQTVYSTISWKSGLVNVVPGSPGTVMGAPDSNNNGEERVLVRFGISGTANVLPSHISNFDPSLMDRITTLTERSLTLGGASSAASSTCRPAAAAASPRDSLATSDISLISHTHGRERRQERNIQRRELQEAIKHGRREQAHPGRNGARRWKYTHRDVVYITDEFSRHEITSWRLSGGDDDDVLGNADVAGGGPMGSHTVIVVDHSGSMRKDDVRGFKTRTAAVYECLAKEFVQKQLDNPREKDGGRQA